VQKLRWAGAVEQGCQLWDIFDLGEHAYVKCIKVH
jgi:hypothetical protein